MTPDWLVKLGIEKIQQKEIGPDVSWLLQELECRLNLTQSNLREITYEQIEEERASREGSDFDPKSTF